MFDLPSQVFYLPEMQSRTTNLVLQAIPIILAQTISLDCKNRPNKFEDSRGVDDSERFDTRGLILLTLLRPWLFLHKTGWNSWHRSSQSLLQGRVLWSFEEVLPGSIISSRTTAGLTVASWSKLIGIWNYNRLPIKNHQVAMNCEQKSEIQLLVPLSWCPSTPSIITR